MRAPLEVPQRGMFSRDLVIDTDGVRRGKHLLPWTDVDHYMCDWQDRGRPGDLVLIPASGSPLRIAPYFDNYLPVADRVFDELHPVLRARPRFTPFTLDDRALALPGVGSCALADLASVELTTLGRIVVVIVHLCDGGEWEPIEPTQIVDLWLWLEVLVERDVAIRASFAFQLPRSLAAIQTKIDADALLPAARVVRRS